MHDMNVSALKCVTWKVRLSNDIQAMMVIYEYYWPRTYKVFQLKIRVDNDDDDGDVDD